jgi:hypothetical protein
MNGALTGTVEVQCEFVAVLHSTSVDK